jgi:glyoxylase-like metal-dependent hydrolase (beta-lactamase superfamily II)
MPDRREGEPAGLGLRRTPVAALPALHQIVLPTPWPVGPVQVYVVEGDPLTLIDTGVRSPASRAALESAFDALGLGLEDVRRIVLTHYHGDHLGQAEQLRRGAPLEVWTHEDEASMCELFSAERDERIEDTEALFREYGVPEELLARQTAMRRRWAAEDPLCGATRVDRRLRSGDRVPFKDFELEVIHAPGHTAGHLLLYEEPSGTLLTGDHLMGNAVPFTDNYYLEGGPDPADPLGRRPRFRGLPRYLESLRRLRGSALRTILPAHGGVLERPARVLDDALLFYEVRVQRIDRALRRVARAGGGATAWEVWQALFPKADPVTEMRTRMLMVIGALDLLEDERRITVRRRPDGVLEQRPR